MQLETILNISNLGEYSYQLLQSLVLIFSISILAIRQFDARYLERRERLYGLNYAGVLFFSFAALMMMLFPIRLSGLGGFLLDPHLAVVILSGVYLGPVNGFAVGVATILMRWGMGGIGWMPWALVSPIVGPLAWFITKEYRNQYTGLLIASIVSTIISTMVFTLFTQHHSSFKLFSPSVNLTLYSIIVGICFIINSLSVVILNWSFTRILSYQRKYRELQIKADTDGMTGLYNHLRFQDLLPFALREANSDSPLSLLMIDVDHFKQYNDTCGHQQGDIILKELACIFQDAIRDGDIAARYGGEEFAIILARADAAAAAIVAERICETVRKTAFNNREKMPGGLVTISVGIATYPGDADGQTSLIMAADKALYHAKHLGRNRVERYYPSMDTDREISSPWINNIGSAELLKGIKEKFTRIEEVMPSGIVIFNWQGEITYANSMAEKIFGLAKNEIESMLYNDPRWNITSVDGTVFPEEKLPFVQVISSSSKVFGVLHTIEHASGQRIIISVNAAPIQDARGHIVGVVAFIHEFTPPTVVGPEVVVQSDMVQDVSVIASEGQHS